jgi:hypothetical protein
MPNVKQAAKNAAFAVGMFVFPIKAKPQEKFDIDAHAAAVQASWRYATKDHLN